MADPTLAKLYEISRRWSERFRTANSPADLVIKTLPRPSYDGDNPYNGFTGAERKKKDQVLQVLRRGSCMQSPVVCDMCGATEKVTFHAEDYFDPFSVVSICFHCHMSLHRRFQSPGKWHERLSACEQNALIDDFRALPMTEMDFAGWLRTNTTGPHDVVERTWPNRLAPDYLPRSRMMRKP